MEWYTYPLRELSEEAYGYWYALMSEEKRRRVDGMRRSDDRCRTVAGEMLARQAVAARCGIAPERVVLAVGAHGKPYVPDLAVEISISHSEDRVVCAVSDTPVGIDVERIRPVDLKVAGRVFTAEEQQYIFGQSPTRTQRGLTEDLPLLTRFFERWTVNEAYGKCLGVGLRCGAVPMAVRGRTYVEDGYVVSIVGTEDLP